MTAERDSTMTDREAFDAAFPSHYQWSEDNRDKAYFGWKLAMESHLATRDAVVSSAAKDATRYQWLREHFRFFNDSMNELRFNIYIDSYADAHELDKAIDDLMPSAALEPLASRKVAVPDALNDIPPEDYGAGINMDCEQSYVDGWNDCRKVMLASKDEVR